MGNANVFLSWCHLSSILGNSWHLRHVLLLLHVLHWHWRHLLLLSRRHSVLLRNLRHSLNLLQLLLLIHSWVKVVLVLVLLSIVVRFLSWSHVHVSLAVVEGCVHGLILLHDFKQLLQNLSHMWVTGQVIQMESSSLLSLIFLKVRLINCFFNLNLSQLFDLVMVDHKSFTVMSLVVHCLLGSCGGIWGLKADKGESISGFTFFKSDLLNLTERLKHLLKFVVSPVGWEVFDIKIASFLRGLISKGVSFLFSFSV